MVRSVPQHLPRALAAVALALSLAACRGAEAPPTGSVRVALAGADPRVARVTATLSGAGLPQLVHDLAPRGDGSWFAFVDNLPQGGLRVDVAATDAAGALLFRGSGETTIGAGLVAELRVFAQETAPPLSYGNTPPRILGIGVSSLAVGIDGTITLNASATDPDPGAVLTYLWRASSGTLSRPDAPVTEWVAPGFPGPQTIFLTVRDEKGAAAEAWFDVLVDLKAPGTGALALDVTLNGAPIVNDVFVTPSRVLAGEPTTLMAAAFDPDGDPLRFQWVSDCPGFFGDPGSPATSFVPAPGIPPGLCTLRLFALDGRGGSAAGWTGVWVGPPPPVGAEPPPPPSPAGFVNAGFESRDYAGWTILDLALVPELTVWGIGRPGLVVSPGDLVHDFADGIDVQMSGSPLVPLDVTPPSGAASAFLIGHAAGTFRIFQPVLVRPDQSSASFLLSFGTLAAWLPGEQSIAVNVRDASDRILATPFMTSPADPPSAPWHRVRVDLAPFRGQSIVLDVEIAGRMSPIAVQLDEFTLE